MLEVGTKAPSLELPDQDGKIRTLKEFKGKKVILYFYSRDNTPGCTNQAVHYSLHADKFAEKGVVILGISKDTVASHKKFEQKHDLKITILADPELKAIKAYDVWQEKKNYGKVYMGVLRTTYLIDEKGIIVFANNKVKAATDAEKMLAMLDE